MKWNFIKVIVWLSARPDIIVGIFNTGIFRLNKMILILKIYRTRISVLALQNLSDFFPTHEQNF